MYVAYESDLFSRHTGQIGGHPNRRDIHSGYGVYCNYHLICHIGIHMESREEDKADK